MISLHRHLLDGHRLAEALRRARAGAAAGPVAVAVATGWSFVSTGAG